MRSKIFLITLSFFSFTLLSQTVIKTQTNKGNNKKVTIKTNSNNSKDIIVKNPTGYNYSNNNVIVKGNRVVVNKPNRPKRIKKRYNKKRRGYVWVKGFWKWSPIFRTYFWQDGYWVKKRRNHFWVNGYWLETNGGYYWVDGFWDKNF